MHRTRLDIYHLAARLKGAPLTSEEQLYLAALFQESRSLSVLCVTKHHLWVVKHHFKWSYPAWLIIINALTSAKVGQLNLDATCSLWMSHGFAVLLDHLVLDSIVQKWVLTCLINYDHFSYEPASCSEVKPFLADLLAAKQLKKQTPI